MSSALIEPTNQASDRLALIQLAASGNANVLGQMPNLASGPSGSDPFWDFLDGVIDVSRWNKLYPYQLILLKVDAGGVYRRTNAVFTLPVPPESITKSTPYAITTIPTLGGIFEEHNGAPIRTIAFSGTTGVLPLRGSPGTDGSSFLDSPALGRIFAGTVQSVSGLGAAAGATLNATAGGGLAPPNLVQDSDVVTVASAGLTGGTSLGLGSGYYQFRLLENFLEKYVAIKKTAAGRDYRLALAMWKDEELLIVTPGALVMNKTAADPFSKTYNLTFRAWRRIRLTDSAGPVKTSQGPTIRSPNAVARSLNVLLQAQRTVNKIGSVASALQGDVDRILEVGRQACLFLKQASATGTALSDLPGNIQQQCKNAWQQYQNQLGLKNPSVNISEQARAAVAVARDVQRVSTRFGKAATGSADPSRAGSGPASELYNRPTDSRTFDQFNPRDPKTFDAFTQTKIGDLNLPASAVGAIARENDRIRNLTRSDWSSMRDDVQQSAINLADAVGMGSPAYDAIYGRTARPQVKTPTAVDSRMLFQLNRMVSELNRLAAAPPSSQGSTRSIDQIAAHAQAAGVPFIRPNSKYAVPFPYGSTMEALALQYLGNPDRWPEIAAINGLRAPFVDEVGFDLPLLVNGSGQQVVVADAFNLYATQTVYLQSNTAGRTACRITGIEKLDDQTFLVSLDAQASAYLIDAGASLHAFLPGTVNSQMLVYIPSQDAPIEDDDFDHTPIPGLNEMDALYRAAGADLLLTPANDLVITPDGDCRLAVGLTNLIQLTRIRISLVRGSLLHHPTIGLGLQPGQSTADMSATQLAAAMRDLFSDDRAFIGVSAVTASKDGPAAIIGASINVAGVQQRIPVSARVQQ